MNKIIFCNNRQKMISNLLKGKQRLHKPLLL